MQTWVVWRVYMDDQWIDALVEKWRNRFGKERIVTWHTNRPRHMAWAVRELEQAIGDGDWSHNGDPVLLKHFRQAVRLEVNVLDDKERLMHVLGKDHQDSPRKKDAADAAVLSWKARSDAIELGIVRLDGDPVNEPEPEPERVRWRPGEDVPDAGKWQSPGGAEGLPMGFMM